MIERVPLLIPPNPTNLRYLRTKRQKMGHLLPLPTIQAAQWEGVERDVEEAGGR